MSLVIASFILCSCFPQKDYAAYEIEDNCCEIVSKLISLSYSHYGDYSKLPDRYKKCISQENFSLLCYRANDNDDYGKLGEDYYEVNFASYPTVKSHEGQKIEIVSECTYECFSYHKNDDLLCGIFGTPICVTCEIKDGDVFVVDSKIQIKPGY